jgi:hypothetical protein
MGDLLQPWHLFVLVFFFLFPLFLIPKIFYLLTLQKALSKCAAASRTMEPGLVWLLLVPVFNLVWHFFVVMGLAKSLKNEFAKRRIFSPEEAPAQPIGLAMCICACCSIIPLLGFLAALAHLVLWIMYWVKVAEYSRLLEEQQVVIQAMPTA